MLEWLAWFTHLENSKVVALLLFFATFCAILFYVFTNRERTKRLESYKFIPLDDEASPGGAIIESKVTNDGRRPDQETSN